MELRNYQINAIDNIYRAWETERNVCLQLATGGGKTVIICELVRKHTNGRVLITAHRRELVCQISLALNSFNIAHDILTTTDGLKDIITSHLFTHNLSHHRPGASVIIACVDTVIRRPIIPNVTLLIQDEAHHVLKDNKWGRVAELYPHAHGFYPTATPMRADGKGLGRHAKGIIDTLVTGISMRELIAQGYLTEYRIFAPPANIDFDSITISASGDYSRQPLITAIRKAKITGDAIEHYIRLTPGKQGLTFAVDVKAAEDLRNAYVDAGVSAELITGEMKDSERTRIMREYRRGRILQLVSVDILGEGVDVPAVSVVSMCRPTLSYSLYAQQFGRALRPSYGKTSAIIIDHVGNVYRHGLPDSRRVWSLDSRDKTKRTTTTASLRTCSNCLSVFDLVARICPYCHTYTPPTCRSIEAVEGDLSELDPNVLRQLRQEADRIMSMPKIPNGASDVIEASIRKRHRERATAQVRLRASILEWVKLHPISTQRLFYRTFGVDIMTAQTYSEILASELTNTIDSEVNKAHNKSHETL